MYAERDLSQTNVAPICDVNASLLLLGGSGLMAVFPLAYATILPALYLPIIVMLIALVCRGVAFEFRFKAERSKPIWNWAFCLGSIVAAVSQGVVLGAFVQGFEAVDRAYAGGTFDWLTPFSMLAGLGVAAGHALRSAERRVGTECVSTGRWRWLLDHSKQKISLT